MDYIIIQAGGQGTRLEYLTKNKPKALVPVQNLPMIFHLFRKFPDKKYIIIADYKKEVLREYLECFTNVKYQVVDAGGKGTCAGLTEALHLIPAEESLMLIWSDLILPDSFEIPELPGDYIGISETFPCRWSYKDGRFEEKSSKEHGVAGLFIFKNRKTFGEVPYEGELVRWMSNKAQTYEPIGLAGTKEFGILKEYEKLEQEKCRPFNKIVIEADRVIKTAIDEQGKALAERENSWYRLATEKKLDCIPKIYDTDPLTIERIRGKNVYEYDFSFQKKKEILEEIIGSIKKLHDTSKYPVDTFSVREAYYSKTIKRLSTVRNLIPFANDEIIVVNGRKCRNIFFYKKQFERKIAEISCDSFTFIHGDCTFSNIMLEDGERPVFIDPRGYFGYTETFGDPQYDWAKLYYSIVGNYDRFNLKDFSLDITEDGVVLNIASNGWSELEDEFYRLSGTDPGRIKLIHAVIWLSLTTYAWQDYDSICGAFYNGLYYLEEIL